MKLFKTATQAKATFTGLMVAMFPTYFIISWFGVNGYILAPVVFIVTASIVRHSQLSDEDKKRW